MEDVDGNGLVEHEERTGIIPHLLFSGTMLNKRLRSKVWEAFIPTFVDGKVVRAECMHCHQAFCGTNGTSSLQRHLASCIPAIHKRLRMQEPTSLPSTQKSTVLAGSDPKQKKLPFLPSCQRKHAGTNDATPVQKEIALPDTPTNMTMKNRAVDENGLHEDLAAPEQKNLALPGIPTDTNRRNQANDENKSAEQMGIPAEMSQKHQDASHEELIKILAMHGHLPRMVDQDGFRKLLAWLNPAVKMPSHDNVMTNTSDLFQKQKSELMQEFKALCSRVCLSVYIWHYDPALSFLCLRVHYIDEEWEKQQKIIAFRAIDSSCNAKETSDIILGAVEQWGLDGNVFCIILDDAFIDDSVALSVKANLQERNPLAANQSLFVVRYATHLCDQVIQVVYDELEKTLEKLAKSSKSTKGLTPAAVQYPNCRYAPSPEDWWTAGRICDKLDDLHGKIDFTPRYPTPAYFFGMLSRVKEDLHFKAVLKGDNTLSRMQEKMKKKFKERWKFCFFHFCMPMVMDPKYRLECMESYIWTSDLDKNEGHYIHDVLDTLASLFNEYLDQVEDPNNTSGSKTSKAPVVDGDTLVEYYRRNQYPYQCSERPMTELDQYLQTPQLTSMPVDLKRTAGKPSALRWWKENSMNYPTVARMARDVLAIPCIDDWKIATRTATLAVSQSGSNEESAGDL